MDRGRFKCAFFVGMHSASIDLDLTVSELNVSLEVLG